MDRLSQAVNGASAGNSVKQARPATDIDSVSDVLSSVSSLANRIEVLADKLCGSTPETTGLSAVSDYPMGVLPRLGFDAAHARCRMADAHRALERIESSLP